jgi:hypothetical protein
MPPVMPQSPAYIAAIAVSNKAFALLTTTNINTPEDVQLIKLLRSSYNASARATRLLGQRHAAFYRKELDAYYKSPEGKARNLS